MHTHLLENPFGVWNKIPELPENASLNESQKFDLLWNETATENISESEVSDYLQRLAEKSSLNEYAERGWFGISPFAWTEGFRVSSIFKPLKWLAVPLIGGMVLLLAGIWKLLKEGKKQIAIAKVRAWIEKLVVTADSGLKKTRNTKDSLFLIRQRYRRDILQNAVKVATCLGFDIPEKDTKPSSVETSLNESLAPNSITLANIVYQKNAVTLKFNVPIGNTGDSRRLDVTFNYDTENKIIKATIYTKDGEVLGKDSPEVQEIIKDFTNAWNIKDGGVYDKIVEDNKNAGLKVSVGDTLEEIANKYSPNVNPEEQEEHKEEEVKNDNIRQEPNDSSINVEDSSNGDNVADSSMRTTHETPDEIPSQSQLPDDSRVDWSLMNSVTASQWFGLKHKTTNFWKEAKSVAVIDTTIAQGNTLRECGLITSYVSQSLTLVANSSVAQSYASIMNKYVEALTKIKASDSMLKQQGSRPVYNNRFSSSNNVYDSKYEMFKDDFKIFEATNDYRSMIFTWWSDKRFQEYLKEIGEFQKVQQQILSQISINDPNIPESKFKYLESLYIKYNEEKLGQMIDILGSEGEEVNKPNKRDDNSNVDYSRINPDNIDKYLIAALSKILANTNYNEWQMHSDAYNQMMKFITELTKTVHTVIDSVAKKVEEKIGGTGNTFEQAVLRFISSKPDAKQNRSLKNLWDNIGVSKLQQRTIVHCQEIDASPEIQYYLDMFMITVPSVIKSKLLPQEEKQPADTTVDSSTNTENGNHV